MYSYQPPLQKTHVNLDFQKTFQNRTHSKGYKCSYYKCWIKDMALKGEQCQSHVRKDEILCQEIEKLKQLKQNFKRLV